MMSILERSLLKLTPLYTDYFKNILKIKFACNMQFAINNIQ
jgi:hypothetical protein